MGRQRRCRDPDRKSSVRREVIVVSAVRLLWPSRFSLRVNISSNSVSWGKVFSWDFVCVRFFFCWVLLEFFFFTSNIALQLWFEYKNVPRVSVRFMSQLMTSFWDILKTLGDGASWRRWVPRGVPLMVILHAFCLLRRQQLPLHMIWPQCSASQWTLSPQSQKQRPKLWKETKINFYAFSVVPKKFWFQLHQYIGVQPPRSYGFHRNT